MRPELSEAITRRHYELRPELEARYGPVGRVRCREDAAFHLSYLAQSVALSAPSIFADYVGWAKIMLAARGIPPDDLANDLEIMREALKAAVPANAYEAAAHHIQVALQTLPHAPDDLPSHIKHDGPLASLANDYLAALLDYDRARAKELIVAALSGGVAVRSLYEHVFTPVQVEVGRLWQVNKISVAEEHYCSAATELIMAQVYVPPPTVQKNGRRMIGMCATGELHDFGARMLCDLFEMEGWDTTYLGANVPVASAVRMIRARKPEVVAISAAMTNRIGSVGEMVRAIRAQADFSRVKIIVGGGAFKLPGLWRKIGADACAKSAGDAVMKATKLAG